jgi:hypothetical protein
MRSRRQHAQIGLGRNACGSRSVKNAPPSDALVDGGNFADKLSAHSRPFFSPFIFLIFFFASLVIRAVPGPEQFPLVPSLSLQRIQTHFSAPRPFPTSYSSFSLPLHSSPTIAMIMVQKPVHLLSSPSTYHHRRHPSAPPVVHVQPTHIPGLLSLSKPHPVTPPRSQQHQNNNRQSRLSHNKPKPTNSAPRPSHQTPTAAVAQPPLSEDLNRVSTPGRPTIKSQSLSITSTVTPEKPPRGRQSSKQSKDKSKQR